MRAALLIFLAAACFFTRTTLADAIDVDGVKGVVSAQVITYTEVQDVSHNAVEALRRQYPAFTDEFQQKLDQVLDDGLQQLVERQLILHSFETDGYKLPDSVIEEVVQDRIRERFGGDRVAFMKKLQEQGITVEQFSKQVRDQWIEVQMRNLNVSRQIFVSPYKVEQYYLAHTNDFSVPDQVHLRLLVINKSGADDTNALPLIREILGKIRDGASFTEMASIHSQGSQQQQGGDQGWERTAGLRQEFRDALATLKPGQTSEPIDTGDAINLLYVENVDAAHVRPLKDVAVDIEGILRGQEQTRLQKQWIAKLQKKTFVRYMR